MSNLTSPKSLAISFGCLSICYGMRALVFPFEFARDFGLPLQSPTIDSKTQASERNPFVAAMGGRTIALGAAILLLAFDNQVGAAGTVTLCCAISGMMDAIVCYTSDAPFVQHAVGTIVLASFGIWLRSPWIWGYWKSKAQPSGEGQPIVETRRVLWHCDIHMCPSNPSRRHLCRTILPARHEDEERAKQLGRSAE